MLKTKKEERIMSTFFDAIGDIFGGFFMLILEILFGPFGFGG